MNKFKQLLAFVIIILFSGYLYAGASDEVNTSSDDFETSVFEDEIYDPLEGINRACLLYTSPSPRDRQKSRMPSSA